MIRLRVFYSFPSKYRKVFKTGESLYQPKEGEYLMNHDRSGLLLALKALHLPVGSRVGVMAYNCHTVMNAVAQAGCELVFIDVDNGLRIDQKDLKKKSDGLKALIVTHLFGILNDVEAIGKQYPKLVIIEDCAHVFGKEIAGDFGVYSIGQGKLPSIGDGGILLVNNAEYAVTIRELYETLSEYSRLEEMKLYCKLCLTDLAYKQWVYRGITSRLKQRKKSQSGKENIVMRKMSRGVRAMFALGKDAVPEQIKLRLENAEKETILMKDNPLVTSVLCGINAFMLVARSLDVEALKRQYAQRGIETATHFANSIMWAKSFGYKGDCPNAERLVKELLMIPVY